MDFYIKFNPLYENTMTYRVKKQLNFGRIFYPADWQDLIIYSPSDRNHAHSGAGFMRFKFDKDENGNLSVYNKVTNPPEHWTESGDNYTMQLDPVDEPIKTPKWELIKEDEGGGEEHYHFIVPLDYTFRFTPEDPLISFVKKPELVKNIQNFISTNACEIVPLDIYGQASIKTSFRVPASKISPELYKRKCRITYRMKQAWVKARKTVIDKIIQSEIRKRIAELSLDDFKCEYKNFKNNTNVYGKYSPIISFKAFQLPSHDGVHECSAKPRQSAAFKNETKIMFITADNKLNDTYSLTKSYGKGTPITNLTPAVLLNSSNKPTKLGLRELKGDSDLVLKGVINETVMSGDKINLGIEPTNISIVEHNPRANNWCEVDFEDLGNEQATDVWRYNFELEGSGEGIPTISISSFKPEDYTIALYQVEQPLTPETTE